MIRFRRISAQKLKDKILRYGKTFQSNGEDCVSVLLFQNEILPLLIILLLIVSVKVDAARDAFCDDVQRRFVSERHQCRLNALSVLFSGHGDKTAAIQRLQAIADEQDNSAISNLVSEIGNENG